MKKLLLALALFLLPSLASAQCNGVFPNSTVCGNATGASNTPRPTSPAAFQGSAGGTNGQIQYNNAGALGGFTASGDATVNTATGAVTLTTVNSSVGTFSGLCLSLTANSKGLLTSIINGICGINAQTASYPIATSDCGKLVTFIGSGDTVTLPAASGFTNGCKLQVCNLNANTQNSNSLIPSGFPLPALSHIWPQQCIGLVVLSAAWQVSEPPGRFRPSFTPNCFVNTGGTNANDGLTTGHSVLDPQQCITLWNSDFDMGGAQPTIQLAGSQTNPQSGGAGALNLIGGSPKVVFVTGSASVLQTTTGTVVAQVQDFGGYFIFSGVTLDCTNALAHPCYSLFHHQQGGTDTNGSTVFKGADPTDIGIYADSFTKINGNTAPTFTGSMKHAVQITNNSAMVISNGITLSSLTAAGNVILADTGSMVTFSGPFALGGSVINQFFEAANNSSIIFSATFSQSGSVTGSPRAYAALNGGQICNGSTNAFPGSAGITTATGWNAGAAVAVSGACIP